MAKDNEKKAQFIANAQAMAQKYKRIAIIDKETGEDVSSDYVTMTKEEAERRRQFGKALGERQEKEQKHYLKGKKQKEKSTETGAFIFSTFKNCEKDFEGLSPQTLARLMYLATYLHYGDNKLICHYNLSCLGKKPRKMPKKCERPPQFVPMKKSTMKRILNLSETPFAEFYDEILRQEYLQEREDGLYLSRDYFYMDAQAPIDLPNGKRSVRIYIRQLVNLYQSIVPRQHKHLGYIFMLMPFINLDWNIVCHQPLAEELEYIQPMTLGEFCDLIGYDRSNAQRLVEYYDAITFDYHGRKMRIVSFIHHERQENMKIIINPYLLYAGNQWDRVAALGEFATEV